MKDKTFIILAVITIVLISIGVTINLNTIERLQISTAATDFGSVNLTVNEMISIEIINALINFSSASPGDSKNSEDLSSGGFNITNDGNVEVNISLRTSSDLFSGTTSNTSFQCKTNSDFDLSTSQTTYIDCRSDEGTINGFVSGLEQTEGNSAEVHLQITVPIDETTGQKSSSMVFTATKS